MSEGLKHDCGKLPMHLLPWESLEEIARVLDYGAKKYSAHNWKLVDQAKDRYMDAMLRHLSKYNQGEKLDTESGLSHLAHTACNALFLLYFEHHEKARL